MVPCLNMLIMADKVLAGAYSRPLDDYALLIRGNILQEIGPRDKMIRSHPGHRILRFEHGVILPGLVNLHAHLELPVLKRPLRRRDYAGWVLDLLKVKAGLTMQDYRSASRKNIRDLICSGTTTVAEISTHDASPALLKESGLRAVVYHEIISMRPGGVAVPGRRRRNTALLHFGLSPHSAHTVSEEALARLRTYVRANGIPLSMHVAETKDELLLFQRKKSGLEKLYEAAGWNRKWAPRVSSSFQYLERLGILGPRFLAVHAVQTTADDIKILARSGASVAHCPRSNRILRTGTMDLRSMIDAGIPVGLGTDSLASSPTLNLWDEMRAAYLLHKSEGVTAADVLNFATMGGAEALGMQHLIGSVTPGKRADCIVVPLPRKNTGDLCSDLLRETKSSIMTMVNGKELFGP